MSPTQRLLLNAFIVGALLVIQSLTFSLGFSRLAAFYLMVGIGLWVANKGDSRQEVLVLRPSERWIWVATLTFISMHIFREALDYPKLAGDLQSALKLGLAELGIAAAFIVIGFRHRASGTLYFLSIVVLGIAAYVGLNLVLEVSGLMPGSVEEGFQSRYVEGTLRWMPALARSNGLFSILNRYALSMAVLMLICARRNIPLLVNMLLALSVVITAYAAIVLEHRAAVMPLLVAPFAYAIGRMRLRTLVPWSALIAMVVVPVVIGSGWWERNAESLLPRAGFELMGDPATVYTLSDRDSIYQYGVEYVSDFKMGLFGDGPVLRDSFPGFPETSRVAYEASLRLGAPPQTFGFHNGFLDLLIAYGPLFTTLFLLIIAVAIMSLGRSDSVVTRMRLSNLAVLLTINVLDGGFSDVNVLFITLVAAAIGAGTIKSAPIFDRTSPAAAIRSGSRVAPARPPARPTHRPALVVHTLQSRGSGRETQTHT